MRHFLPAAGLALAACLSSTAPSAAASITESVRSVSPVPVTLDRSLRTEALDATGLDAGHFVAIKDVPSEADHLSVSMELGGEPVVLDLQRWSVRSSVYRVLVDDGTGALREVEPGPVRTLRGTVDGMPGATVTGGLTQHGLHLTIHGVDGTRTHLEPLGDRVTEGPAGLHVVHVDTQIAPHDGRCGVEDVANAPADPLTRGEFVGGGPLEGSGPLDVAELACDADTEYFNDYGSIEAVEDRINLIINTVNEQYESQTNITHEISAIVIRTGTDPYTSNNASTRLCQFITEWSNNQASVQRDVAHLFTGANINGGTIGIAADIGDTGICVNQGGCQGGTFGTFGSYCLSESDFNGNFASATDLTAHELGHLWGAFHCSCTSFTMNAFITSANQFTGGSINSITNYAATRECLNSGPPSGCCFPNGSCAEVQSEEQCNNLGGVFLGDEVPCTECVPTEGACCFSDGSCVVIEESICIQVGGVFSGAGTSCDDACTPACPGDFDGSGAIDFADIVQVLAVWGPCADCDEDLDMNGDVGFSDLVELLSFFGGCAG